MTTITSVGLTDEQIAAIGRGEEIPPGNKATAIARLFTSAVAARKHLVAVKQETYAVRFDQTITDLSASLYAAGTQISGRPMKSLFDVEELAERINEGSRQISCGCCTVGCCCLNHMDIPRGIRPQQCALHSGTGEVVVLRA